MQLDPIRRQARLAFEIIEKPDSGDPHRHIGILKSRGRSEHRVELGPRMGDARGEGTTRVNTTGRRYLSNHGATISIGNNHVIIGIVHSDIFFQNCIYYVGCRFGGWNTLGVRQALWHCDS